MQKRKQQRSKLEPRGVKCKFLGYDDCSPSYVVQEIDSGKIHFARNTIFNENEIPSSDFSGDSVVRSDDGSIIDIFEKIAEKKTNENSTNQEKVETTNLRTYAQEEEQSDEVESLGNDQALFEVCNDATMSQVVREETEENDNRAQGTSYRPNLNDCQVVLGGQIFRCLPCENIVDRSEASEKKEKSPLKKLLRRGARNRSVPTKYGTTYTHKSEKVDSFEPKTYSEAVESSDKALWLVAMQQEMNAFADNETWSLVERPKDKNVINGKWVFKVKQNEEGEIDKYKARYVAKGYAQVEGVDFNETTLKHVDLKHSEQY